MFRIETNLFDYETPMCKTFDEFNYLLKIDTDLFTKDLPEFKTFFLKILGYMNGTIKFHGFQINQRIMMNWNMVASLFSSWTELVNGLAVTGRAKEIVMEGI